MKGSKFDFMLIIVADTIFADFFINSFVNSDTKILQWVIRYRLVQLQLYRVISISEMQLVYLAWVEQIHFRMPEKTS